MFPITKLTLLNIPCPTSVPFKNNNDNHPRSQKMYIKKIVT